MNRIYVPYTRVCVDSCALLMQSMLCFRATWRLVSTCLPFSGLVQHIRSVDHPRTWTNRVTITDGGLDSRATIDGLCTVQVIVELRVFMFLSCYRL